jgi:carnitine O-acetyltransferase
MTSSTVVKSKMLGHQASLPKLPVPALDETLSKYLRSVKPLLNETEYLKTVQAVEEFKKPGGWGEKLQERLVSKANDPSVDNWLDRWWIDLAYFGYRDPLPFFSSYYFAYKDDIRVKKNTQRAAQIVSAALEFRKAVLR